MRYNFLNELQNRRVLQILSDIFGFLEGAVVRMRVRVWV